jgi:hypothetical protein
MATQPRTGKAKPPAEIGPRQRMTYVKIRLDEVRAELARLVEERKKLQAVIAAERAKGLK